MIEAKRYNLHIRNAAEEDPGGQDDAEGLVVLDRKVKERNDLKEPSRYAVVFLNDDYTTVEWVGSLLIQLFNKSPEEAALITEEVHTKGKGIAGIYPKDIAETKTVQAIQYSQAAGHPLQATVEEV